MSLMGLDDSQLRRGRTPMRHLVSRQPAGTPTLAWTVTSNGHATRPVRSLPGALVSPGPRAAGAKVRGGVDSLGIAIAGTLAEIDAASQLERDRETMPGGQIEKPRTRMAGGATMVPIPCAVALGKVTARRAPVVRRVAVGAALSMGLVTSLMAADVWDSKPFHTWTDKELAKVLTDSPWAGKGAISYVQNRAGQPPIRETALVTWASARVMRQALAREAFGVTAAVPGEAAA